MFLQDSSRYPTRCTNESTNTLLQNSVVFETQPCIGAKSLQLYNAFYITIPGKKCLQIYAQCLHCRW